MSRTRMTEKNAFFKYTLPWYLTFAVIFFIFSAMVFLFVVNTVRETIITNSISALKQNSRSVDLVKASIESFADSVTHDSKIINYLTLKEKNNSTYRTRSAAFSLPTLVYSDHLVTEYYLYDINKDILFRPHSAYKRLCEYYEEFFYIEGISYDEWHGELLTSPTSGHYLPASNTVLNTRRSRSVPYVRSIVNQSGTMVGQAVFFINENVLHGSLAPLLDIGSTMAYITDETGQLIVSTSSSPADIELIATGFAEGRLPSGEKCISASYQSPVSHWTYHAIIPNSSIYHRIKTLQQVMFWTLCGMIIIGICLSLGFAWRYTIPLKKIMMKIRSNSKDFKANNDPFELMSNEITHLLESREKLESSRKRQKELLSETIVF